MKERVCIPGVPSPCCWPGTCSLGGYCSSTEALRTPGSPAGAEGFLAADADRDSRISAGRCFGTGLAAESICSLVDQVPRDSGTCSFHNHISLAKDSRDGSRLSLPACSRRILQHRS